ncbi:hypothetical protein [Agromyces bracchium]|uniref:Uncharacterized protein n=1 Tax=Agromyces bracchium TaxID=88376 RepID=A0A6I3M4Q5_9MICO|nr:hypothetical protein [Agromyces bracchium]MTH68449.1 hypothetical protein [Agromyces bracchium]
MEMIVAGVIGALVITALVVVVAVRDRRAGTASEIRATEGGAAHPDAQARAYGTDAARDAGAGAV